MVKLASITLTKNEGHRLRDLLWLLRGYVDYMIVVDGGSTDGTVQLARSLGAHVIVNLSKDFGEVRNAGHIAAKEFGCDWVVHIDADETWGAGMVMSLKKLITMNSYTRSFRFPRANLPDYKNYPDYQVRVMTVDVEWHGETHEVPFAPEENIPIDKISCATVAYACILHEERAKAKEQRSWWDTPKE